MKTKNCEILKGTIYVPTIKPGKLRYTSPFKLYDIRPNSLRQNPIKIKFHRLCKMYIECCMGFVRLLGNEN